MPCMTGFLFYLKGFISWGSEHTDLKYGKCACVCVLSQIQLSVTPWTAAHQAPLFEGFSRQEY